jgi:hypothetical protein
MNDFLLIFMGIFILLLIFLLFILLAYVYHTYTTYTVDINKNLETSEDTINNTSNAFNKLQDTVINELAKVNKNQETIVKTLPDNLISLNSNLLNIFELSSNNNKITDITNKKIEFNNIGITKPFTSYKNFTTITDKDTNFLTICNNKSAEKQACIKMNIDDSDIFNIYTSNFNKNNISGINIYDSNNGILASFDTFNKKILLGSSVNPAISIQNNVYTSDVIVCKCTYAPAAAAVAAVDGVGGSPPTSAKITLNIISNIDIGVDKFINLPIFNNFTINTTIQTPVSEATLPQYTNSILKFKPGTVITKNTIKIININIVNPSVTTEMTTTGYITTV